MAPEKVLIDREKLEHAAQLTSMLHTNSYGGEAYESYTQVNKAQNCLGSWLDSDNLLKKALAKVFPRQFQMLHDVNALLSSSLELSNRSYEKAEQAHILVRALHKDLREHLVVSHELEQVYPPIIVRIAQQRGVDPSQVTELVDGEALFFNKEGTQIWALLRGVSSIKVVRDRYIIYDDATATRYSFLVEPANQTYILVRERLPIPESLLGCTVATAIDRQRVRKAQQAAEKSNT
jgi:hypothetical protein